VFLESRFARGTLRPASVKRIHSEPIDSEGESVKKLITASLAIALCGTVALAQEKAAAKPAAKPAAAPAAVTDPIIIAAGNITVRQSEFEAAIKTLPAEYQQYAMGPGRKQFGEDFLRMKLLAAEGTKAGLDKDPAVVSQLNLIRENLVANAQLATIEKGITVPEDTIKSVYDANKKDYEQVTARHILISPKGSPVPLPEGKKELTDAEAKAKAEEIRAKIVAGASFEELAKTESYDTSTGALGGSLGAFGHGQMVGEFEEAAFKAKSGELTPVVKTQFGYHIIKVETNELTPLAQVRETIEKEERQKLVQAALDAIKTKANATFNSTYFPEAAPAPTPAPAVAPETKPVTQ
jgi:peptidyl-prolyl cis-trans isomerase C